MDDWEIHRNPLTFAGKDLQAFSEFDLAGGDFSSLDLSDCGLTSVPESIAQLKSLVSIDLSGNGLTTLPSWLMELPRLRELNVSSNNLSSLPLCGLPDGMASLDLSFNRIRRLPEEWSSGSSLDFLDISYNRFTALPPQLCNFDKLNCLLANGNSISHLNIDLHGMHGLRVLHVQENVITHVPDGFFPTDLREAYLSGNAIEEFPVFPEPINLEVLNLERNCLESIHPSITNLRRLKMLFVHTNRLKDISPYICRLNTLEMLFVQNNQITTIPRMLQDLENLRGAYLGGNPIEVNELASKDTRFGMVFANPQELVA